MIYTVTGPIKKEELGVTLSHEHLAWDYRESWKLYFYKMYDDETIEMLFNLLSPVFKKIKKNGCRTIVETSPPRGGQNLILMQKLSRQFGINIIPNTGMPFQRCIYEIHKSFNEKELTKRWIQDFENGLDNVDNIVIRPGYIKLLLGDEGNGSLPTVDKKILKAAIEASKATGMPIHCHLLEAKMAEEAIDILERESFNFSKFLWAHAGNEGNLKVIEKAFSKGMWLGFDQIQSEKYFEYCSLIKEAIKRGYQDRILISQDYDFYEQITECGENHPCASIFTDFIPHCIENEINKDVLINILTNNPANFYDI